MPVPGYTPNYSNESPYRVTPLAGNFMAYYIHRTIEPHVDDELILIDTIRYENRPDLLSYDLYGTPDLWWVFGVRNGWEDPVHDLKLNKNVIVPPIEYIRSVL